MYDLPAEWADWEIVCELGSGSYGSVYEIRRTDNPEMRAAVKVIEIPKEPSEINELVSQGFEPDQVRTYFDEKVRDFTQEIRVMIRLRETQNTVRIEDYKVIPRENGIGSLIFIRMELLVPLDDFLCGREVSEDLVLRIGTDICTALNVCVRSDIIHRDVKPANILVSGQSDSNPVFKLGDFGIARRMESRTGGMSQKGTPAYIAPEVAMNRPYDSRADIYSLGLTLYSLLNNNRLPFYPVKQVYTYGDKEKALDTRLKGEKIPPPVNASDALAKVILKACAFRPEDRYATVADFLDALHDIQKNRGKRRAGPKKNRRTLLLCAGSLAAVILISFAVGWPWDILRGNKEDRPLIDTETVSQEETEKSLLLAQYQAEEDPDESHFRTSEIEGGVAITGYTGEKTSIVLPAEWHGKKVLQLGDGNSSENVSGLLETAVIPEGVTDIKSGFFTGSVHTVFLSSTVSSIDEDAFVSAAELTRIDVAEQNPFFYSVDSVLFEKGSDRLRLYPRGRSGPSYTVPVGTKGIGKGAFMGAGTFAVELPSCITSIEDGAFAGSMLSGINLPEGLVSIGQKAFEDTGLREVQLPSTLTDVGEGAFAGCRDLAVLFIGRNTHVIGSGAFAGTRVSLTVDEDNPNFRITDRCLVDTVSDRLLYCFCEGNTAYVPEGVRVIASRAFEGTDYSEIRLPDSVDTLERCAFLDCSGLTEFTVPQAVTRLESRVFSGCKALKSVTVPSSVTVIEPDCFENCSPDLVLTAPENTVASAFAAAYGFHWEEPEMGFLETIADLVERIQSGGEDK